MGTIAERLQLKRHVPSAVDRAIFEILSPVVERSVTIACYTTVELIMKDFALDPDEVGGWDVGLRALPWTRVWWVAGM